MRSQLWVVIIHMSAIDIKLFSISLWGHQILLQRRGWDKTCKCVWKVEAGSRTSYHEELAKLCDFEKQHNLWPWTYCAGAKATPPSGETVCTRICWLSLSIFQDLICWLSCFLELCSGLKMCFQVARVQIFFMMNSGVLFLWRTLSRWWSFYFRNKEKVDNISVFHFIFSLGILKWEMLAMKC